MFSWYRSPSRTEAKNQCVPTLQKASQSPAGKQHITAYRIGIDESSTVCPESPGKSACMTVCSLSFGHLSFIALAGGRAYSRAAIMGGRAYSRAAIISTVKTSRLASTLALPGTLAFPGTLVLPDTCLWPRLQSNRISWRASVSPRC